MIADPDLVPGGRVVPREVQAIEDPLLAVRLQFDTAMRPGQFLNDVADPLVVV